MSDILTKIRYEREGRPATWRRIADYFLENYKSAAQARMEDVRRTLGVSDGSIINFVRSLGCEGFSHFKLMLARADGRRLADRYTADGGDTLSRICSETRGAIDGLESGVEPSLVSALAVAITDAVRVVIMGRETSASVAEIFARYLLLLGVPCHVVKETNQTALTAATMTSGELAIAISYSGETADVASSLETARKRGAKTASITASGGSRIAELSDISIVIPSDEAERGDFPIVTRLGQIIAANAVCAEVAEITKKRGNKNANIK